MRPFPSNYTVNNYNVSMERPLNSQKAGLLPCSSQAHFTSVLSWHNKQWWETTVPNTDSRHSNTWTDAPCGTRRLQMQLAMDKAS